MPKTSGTDQRLTSSPGEDMFPRVSPDGKWIACTEASRAGIDEDHPAWSPDGRSIAYTTNANGGQQIAVRPAEGGPERILTNFAEGYFYGPLFSPDGKYLYFVSNRRENTVPSEIGPASIAQMDARSDLSGTRALLHGPRGQAAAEDDIFNVDASCLFRCFRSRPSQ